jgi:transposase-like protein
VKGVSLYDSWLRQLTRERERLADAEKKRADALKEIARLEKKLANAKQRGRGR